MNDGVNLIPWVAERFLTLKVCCFIHKNICVFALWFARSSSRVGERVKIPKDGSAKVSATLI